jgi:hypothetical protein
VTVERNTSFNTTKCIVVTSLILTRITAVQCTVLVWYMYCVRLRVYRTGTRYQRAAERRRRCVDDDM